MTRARFWWVTTIVGMVVMGFQATVLAEPAPLLDGQWESLAPNNAYIIKVTWNQAGARYEGVLVRHGQLSAKFGYAIGEMCWAAKVSPNPALLEIMEEWRSGGNGRPAQVRWVRAGVWLNQITTTSLVTSSSRFRRIDASPASPASAGGASAAPSGSPWKYRAGMPSADEVAQKVSGTDDVDKQARQVAAFIELDRINESLTQRTGPNMGDELRESYKLNRIYLTGRLQAENRLRAAAGRAYVNPYLNNDAFRRELTTLFPGVGQLLEARRQADAAAAQSKADKAAAVAKTRAAQMQEAQEQAEARAKVEQKKRAAQEEQEAGDRRVKAAADTEVRRLALADGERGAGQTDMKVFGVPLGQVLPLASCEAVGHTEPGLFGPIVESKQTCVMKRGDGDLSIHWGEGALPEWAQYNLQADIKTDVIVSMTIVVPSWPRPPSESIGFGLIGGIVASAQNSGAERGYESEVKAGPARAEKAQGELRKKYKKPPSWSKEASFSHGNVVIRRIYALEWNLPGLHVSYTPDVHEDTIVIEVASVAKARAEGQRKQELAEPKI